MNARWMIVCLMNEVQVKCYYVLGNMKRVKEIKI